MKAELRPALEHHVRRGAKLDDDLRGLAGHRLAAAQQEGDALPPPIVDLELHHAEGGRLALRRHVGLVAILAILAANGIGEDVLAGHRPDRPQHLDLLVAHRIGVEAAGRFHGGEGEELEEVVLEHVAEHAHAVVVGAAMADGHFLGGGDLHVVDEVAVPHGLEDAIGEAEHQHVLHGFLAQVVVDAEDLVFGEDLVRRRR